MSNEMIERVANGIVQTLKDKGYGQCADRNGMELAKAAIEAMREPTEAMLNIDSNLGYEMAWKRMIDAALKE